MATDVRFEQQVPVRIEYKGLGLRTAVRLGLLLEKCVVVEVKAVEHLLRIQRSQLFAYLKVTGHHVGLLINFNVHLLRSGMRRVLVG